jgi:AraC-like DNA-binding protein
MDQQVESSCTEPSPHYDRVVCDTDYCSRHKALSLFSETIASAFMPWAFKYEPEEDFSGRVEGLILDSGAVARVKMSPATATRSSVELERSSSDCIYANYVLLGEIQVAQCGRATVARRGDLVTYDSSQPVTVIKSNADPYEDLTLRIPKFLLAESCREETALHNVCIEAEKIISPLSSCLAFLSQNLLTTSREELSALYEVCAQLLPVAASYVHRADNGTDYLERPSNFYGRELTAFIDEHLADAELSPRFAAEHLGISVRYVHKQFAAKGMTFSAYVTTKRLEFIRRDLISAACRNQPISAIAYRWGFNDLSTFIRAFKKKFSCSPSQYRARF